VARLYHHLQRAASTAKRHADQILLEVAGVTTAQAALLLVVGAERPPTQRDVATQLGVSEPSVAAMVERLAREGYLQRGRDDRDGRVRTLQLTAEGERVLAGARAAFEEVNERLQAALGSTDAVDLLDAQLRAVEDALSIPRLRDRDTRNP
jgi:DNA-binding MarR family transcriptional regulator